MVAMNTISKTNVLSFTPTSIVKIVADKRVRRRSRHPHSTIVLHRRCAYLPIKITKHVLIAIVLVWKPMCIDCGCFNLCNSDCSRTTVTQLWEAFKQKAVPLAAQRSRMEFAGRVLPDVTGVCPPCAGT